MSLEVNNIGLDVTTNVFNESDRKIKVHRKNAEKSKVAGATEAFIKRSVDILAGICGLVILVPLTIAIWVARKILKEDDGPIFYDQLRFGKDGKQFKIYKFRSMVTDADKVLNEYLASNPEAMAEYKEYKKLKEDPRVTRIGDFIRRTSLDEFPQLINVLKGEMTLVGPRPYLPREKEDMGIYYKYIVEMKPGVTGYWQTSGRNDVSFDRRLKMDYEYRMNHNLMEDIKIFFKTFSCILK